MIDDAEVLARARAVWRATAPTADEHHRGALRVARKLRLQRRAHAPRTVWVLAGSVAACMATLAYAGKGHLADVSEPQRTLLAPGLTKALHFGAGQRASRDGDERASIEDPGAELPAMARVAQPPSSVAQEPVAAPLPAPSPAALATTSVVGKAASLLSAPSTVAALGSPATSRVDSASLRDAHPAPAAPSGSLIAAREDAPSRAPRRGAGGGRAGATTSEDASWRAVSDALTASDQAGAAQLLERLAHHGSDAETRSKAKLGLAQLEVSRGHCGKARKLALAIAAKPGTDTNTVRRALELATRCQH